MSQVKYNNPNAKCTWKQFKRAKAMGFKGTPKQFHNTYSSMALYSKDFGDKPKPQSNSVSNKVSKLDSNAYSNSLMALVKVSLEQGKVDVAKALLNL